jgi:hypothetical protein
MSCIAQGNIQNRRKNNHLFFAMCNMPICCMNVFTSLRSRTILTLESERDLDQLQQFT